MHICLSGSWHVCIAFRIKLYVTLHYITPLQSSNNFVLLFQVYQAGSGSYVCHNKYFGRRLAEEGVHETLYEFLNNGRELRTDLVEPIVERLRRLYAMVAKQNTFRFYSSSLLIMYDGAETTPFHAGEDSHASSSQPSDCSLSDADDGAVQAGPSHERQQCCSWDWEQTYHKDSSPRVDVRMIDFAHATHQGFRGDRTVHSGPDNGYLFGLENLCHMFEMIKARAS